MSAPLTVGTAGHVDHGKTVLVRALTGVETDRLAEERARGISIVLGFAPLRLPGGRVLSLIDVPGHERLVRVMVAGATGIDLFLLVIAADDGVMPQTREHVRVLRALGVSRGVVAITKSDLADPAAATEQARLLVPGAEVVACCARTGEGIAALGAALERTAASVPARADDSEAPLRPPVLHVDRAFTIRGAGTVVTGTLWSGQIACGDRLWLLPSDRQVRVRAVQVHDHGVEHALAGQRVAVNLAGVRRGTVARGDVLAGPGAAARATHRIEAELSVDAPLAAGERVQVHHGTRDTPARALRLAPGRWRLTTQRPLIAAAGDRLVVRRIAPPDTLGGGVIVATAPVGRAPSRNGRPDARVGAGRADAAAATPRPRPEAPTRAGPQAPPAPALAPEALALEQRLRAAGHEPLSQAQLGPDARHLAALRAANRAVRVGRSMYAHPDAIAEVRAVVERVARAEGTITLARLRDELATSRKYAQALLEHLDATRVTLRRADDRRTLRGDGSGAAVG